VMVREAQCICFALQRVLARDPTNSELLSYDQSLVTDYGHQIELSLMWVGGCARCRWFFVYKLKVRVLVERSLYGLYRPVAAKPGNDLHRTLMAGPAHILTYYRSIPNLIVTKERHIA
jgi:hypothetical protein